ncbi:MAG: GNAT family N-acetyltransferase [Sphingopyxis sp.]
MVDAHEPGAVVMETARTRLRNWRVDDVAPFMDHLNTSAVMRWLGGVQDADFYHATHQRIADCAAQYGHCFWIVERKSDDAILGFCGLKRTNVPGAPMLGDVEIGWRLREDAWGQGSARECAHACMDAAFHRYDAPHVVALTVRQNTPSWGLMQRLGMVRARELDFTDDRWGAELAAVIVYRMDRKDWTQ